MSVRRLSIVLDLDSNQFTTRMADATGRVRVFSREIERGSGRVESFTQSVHRSHSSLDRFNRQVWKMQLTLYSVTFLFGGFTAGLLKMNAEAQRSIALLSGLSKATTDAGRQAEAAADFRYLREFARQAPYDLETLTNVFVKLKAAGIDPTAGAMRALVDGVAKFGGSSDLLNRAVVAIAQMAGKGTVSMEELRQQLGEAMPTALRIMARSAGMSIQEFVDQVSKGRVLWKDVQDKFFAELQKDAEGASARLMETLGGQWNRFKTNIREIVLAIGGFQTDGSFMKGGFMYELTQGMKDLNEVLTDPKFINGAREFGERLAHLLLRAKDFITFIADNIDTITQFGVVLAAMWAGRLVSDGINGLIGRMAALSQAQKAVGADALSTKAALVSTFTASRQAAVEAAKAAQDTLAARRTEVAAIKAKRAELELERQAYVQNIALAEQQRAAAVQALNAARASNAAGFGSVATGTTVAAIRDRDQATRALIQSRRMLTQVDAQLAATEHQLAAAEHAEAAAATAAAAATSRLTLAHRAATVAATVLTGALRGLLTLVGGPLGVAFIAVATALSMVVGGMNDATQSTESLRNEIDLTKEALARAKELLSPTTTDVQNMGDEAEVAAGKMSSFAGETGRAADELYRLADAKKKAQLAELEERYTKLSEKVADAQTHTMGMAGYLYLHEPPRSPQHAFQINKRYWGTLFKNIWTWGDFEREQQQIIEEGKQELETTLQQIVALSKEESTEQIAEGMKRTGEWHRSTGDGGKGGGKGGKRSKLSAADRLEARIDNLESSEEGIRGLIETLDEGSMAAAQMRARIESLREQGEKITKDQEVRAVEAARRNANLQAAYNKVRDIMGQVREQNLAAAEAVAALGDSFGETEGKVQKFERQMNLAQAEVERLYPELLRDEAAYKKFTQAVESAKNDYRLTQVAEAARQLSQEMRDLANTSIDPDLAVWDDWRKKMTEIGADLESAMKLPEEDGRNKTIASLMKSRREWADRFIAELEFAEQENIRSIREGLMTADQARQEAYDREVKRIEALTDISHMNEEQKALYAERMATLRAQALEMAEAKFLRDNESSAQKLAREWEDITANMREMSGKWMDDFVTQLSRGEATFGDFLEGILMDYLEMLLRAKMASFMQPAMDGLANFLGSTIGSFFGLPGSVTPTSPSTGINLGVNLSPGAGFGARTPTMSAGSYHIGGIAGSSDMLRAVSPDVFVGAQRFHDGGFPGLKNDEVAAILKKGEGVFTPEQMKALGAGATAPNVSINVINESGTPLDATQQGGPRFDGERYIIDVVVNAMSRPGPVRNAVLNLR